MHVGGWVGYGCGYAYSCVFSVNVCVRTYVIVRMCSLCVCAGDPYASSDYKPSFLSDDELKQLVVEVRERRGGERGKGEEGEGRGRGEGACVGCVDRVGVSVGMSGVRVWECEFGSELESTSEGEWICVRCVD